MAGGLTVSNVMKHHRFSFVMSVAIGLCLAQTAVAQDERLEIKPPEEIIIPEAVPAPPSESEEADIICLLYTSPSPRDGLLSRMPSSA